MENHQATRDFPSSGASSATAEDSVETQLRTWGPQNPEDNGDLSKPWTMKPGQPSEVAKWRTTKLCPFSLDQVHP